MRKTLSLFILVLAGSWARPAPAECPGTSACVHEAGPRQGATGEGEFDGNGMTPPDHWPAATRRPARGAPRWSTLSAPLLVW